MAAGVNPVIFNSYGALLNSTAGGRHVYAADPAIQLTELYTHRRHDAQAAAIAACRERAALRPDAAATAVFGDDALGWAYKVFRWADWAGDADPPPAACVTAEERRNQLEAAGEPAERRRILLFNVIAAAEWAPDRAFLLQLQWAFRRASDFLYDATDGLMALGQVVIGGPELLPCADIHVMASNRLHPRSWVGGLLHPDKFQPVRVGRGIWHDRNHVTLPWDEPEGYRTLVHEWCHYALSLMDGYIESRRDAGGDVVVPTIQMTSTSIMESLDGTSELFSQEGVRGPTVRDDAWAAIAREFPQLVPPGAPPAAPLNGPTRLPLPLPTLRVTAALAATAPAAALPLGAELLALLTGGLRPSPMLADLFRGERLDLRRALSGRAWVHLLRHDVAGAIVDVLAQGTLDARALEEPFPLYGAQAGDTVHVCYESPLGVSVIAAAELRDEGGLLLPGPWRRQEPHTQLADVVPLPDADPAALRVSVVVQGRERPALAVVTQQGDEGPPAPAGGPVTLRRLDGHLVLRWRDGGVSIGAYSHGGGPPTHGGISPGLDGGLVLGGADAPAGTVKTPITAGSSDGRVMIFFEPFPLAVEPGAAGAQQRYYHTVRVVTTALHGVDLPPPWPDYMPASGLYSIAASRPLPADLNPTLVINLDPLEIGPGRQARVFLWQDGQWHARDTSTAPACRRFIYLPLRGTELAAEVGDYEAALAAPPDPRVVAVRVFWEPVR
jgi:hypothetical protein